ncbi:VanZ family protein [Kitasatospora sp. NPDC088346]|uniref:VanZ family protein n=1 Tax=Kitasatospora sp. NPDC088346 TaxID=3364073 RepID=UPI00380F44A4
MIEAALRGNQSLVLTAAVLWALTAVPAWFAGRRYGFSAVAAVGAAGALSLVLAATLYPLSPQAPASMTCTLQRDAVGALLGDQGLLNAAMFVPAAFFLTVLTRRPLPVAAACAVLSGAIEVTQALVSGMGRACDSADLEANVAGALLGCLAGRLWLRRAGSRALGREIRLTSVIAVGGGAVLAAVAVPALLFVVADVSDGHRADGAQTAAATDAAHRFFGAGTAVRRVQFSPGGSGRPGRVEIATAAGNLVLDWPSREVSSGVLGSVPEQPGGRPQLSQEAALAAGTDFARTHFPWALSDSSSTVYPAGGPDSTAKLVQWRSRVDGVLMPMRLDLVVGDDRRVVSFSARHVPPPALPKPAVSAERARQLATRPGMTVTGGELLAKADERGTWHLCWLLTLAPAGLAGPSNAPGPAQPARGGDGPGQAVVFLDAVTGEPFGGGGLLDADH